MENCVNCGAGVVEPIIDHAGNEWCPICAEVNLFQSEIDDEYYPRDRRVRFENKYMTEDQKEEILEEEYFICESCGEHEHNDESTEVETARRYGDSNLQNWCRTCVDDDTTVCDDCGTATSFSTINVVDGENFCGDCYNNNVNECEGCGVHVTTDNTHWRDDNSYCEDCVPSDIIHGYFYNPHSIFHKEEYENNKGVYYKKQTAYLGVEIEVDTPNDSANNVAEACDLLHNEDYTYLKEDSSIDGFEIVTHPSTFETLKNKYNWREKLTQLQDNGARGYDSGDCGIHVHVTKSAYQPIVWWKAIKFMSKCESQILKFSQRGDNLSYCRIKDVYDYDNGAECNFIKQYPRNSNTRYLALNFGDRQPTGEFRIFRSTTHHERFWASIEFSYGLIDFCVHHGYSHIKRTASWILWEEFMEHIKKLGYQTLYNHLVKRNIK